MSHPKITVSMVIAGGNYDNKFRLNSTTGQLSCQPLDRESSSLYNLTIQAVDQGSPPRSTLSTILINVLDDNDNDPSFQQEAYEAEIPEDTAVGTSVLQVQATDADVGLNAHISYSMNNDAQGQFRINNVTGVLTTAGYVVKILKCITSGKGQKACDRPQEYFVF